MVDFESAGKTGAAATANMKIAQAKKATRSKRILRTTGNDMVPSARAFSRSRSAHARAFLTFTCASARFLKFRPCCARPESRDFLRNDGALTDERLRRKIRG